MPLYEIVLRFPDGDEIRLTDSDPRIDGHVRINGQVLEIVAETESSTAGVARRYVVCGERSGAP